MTAIPNVVDIAFCDTGVATLPGTIDPITSKYYLIDLMRALLEIFFELLVD
jgi:hypothetical protein